MSTPILLTKIRLPQLRQELVQRPKLINELNRGIKRKLTLVSAPAGFGKTTLISDWLQTMREDESVPFYFAWFTLDEGDNDPGQFMIYLIEALVQANAIDAKFGKGLQHILQSPQPPPIDSILIALINEISNRSDKIVFVLDDYHRVQAQPIHEILVFILENLPLSAHLVITTREDPPLPLSRLRVQNQLSEFRARDLLFSLGEAGEFLNRIMDLSLSEKEIQLLEKRTEGWIAGLQLAAISLQGHNDVPGFIRTFSGSDRLVLDYLIEEVINQQTEDIQNFLLDTAILNRLSGPLCNAVTGQRNGQAVLEMLERSNLFLIPLDNERRWYRYHHLFADLLKQRLQRTQTKDIQSLYKRASMWFEKNSYINEAIDNLLMAQDFNQAALLIEGKIDDLWLQGENAKLRHWLDLMPDEILNSRPNLCVYHTWYLFNTGQMEKAEAAIQLAEETIRQNESETTILQGRLAAVRAFMLAGKMDVQNIIKFADQALTLLPETEVNWRSLTAIILGDVYAYVGNLNAAYEARLEAVKAWQETGNIYWTFVASLKLMSTLRSIGHLQKTIEISRQQMEIVTEHGLSQIRAISWLFAIWGETLAELNQLEAAEALVEKIIESNKNSPDAAMIGWNGICLMRISISKQDISGADMLVQEMKNKAKEANVQPWLWSLINAWQTQVWLLQNKMEEAVQWAHEQAEKNNREIPWIREIENAVRARVYLLSGRLDEAVNLLKDLYAAAESGGRVSKSIEFLILQSLAFQAGDHVDQAVYVLGKAIKLAKPGGFIRIFVDEGPQMAKLLYLTLKKDIEPVYVRKILAAFPAVQSEKPAEKTQPASDSDWIEPLSDRELEVLHLIAAGHSRQEIASRLVVSLNTVKTHIRNIFSKLGVNSQMQAVGKARGLGFLDKD